jgi:prephenate dehydratase
MKIRMKISTLGPEGTFSHEAVIKYNKKATITFKNTIWDVFDSVRKGEVEKGIVPIENSISGTVGLTLDALMDYDLEISGEIIIPIHHHLAAWGKISDIKSVFSNLQAYSQCMRFIKANIPEAELIQMASNSKSAEELSKVSGVPYAAIVPELAMKRYKLKCLAKNIQDSKFNVTRFVVLGTQAQKPTGTDRTSIAIYPHMDKPGLLYELIGEFAQRKINLTKIESHPSKGRLGDYIFFIDLQGHSQDKEVKSAFRRIEKNFFLKILGSYPREY